MAVNPATADNLATVNNLATEAKLAMVANLATVPTARSVGNLTALALATANKLAMVVPALDTVLSHSVTGEATCEETEEVSLYCRLTQVVHHVK